MKFYEIELNFFIQKLIILIQPCSYFAVYIALLRQK